MLKRSLFLIALSFALSGCATTELKPEQKASLKKIGVYAAVGTNMNYDHIGTTIFSNKLQGEALNWDMNDYIAQKVVAQLQAKNYQVNILKPATSTTLPHLDQAEFAAVKTLAQAQGDDAILIIKPGSVPDEGNDMHFRTGYGLINRTFFGMDRTAAYFLTSVSLNNVADGKSMSNAMGYDIWTGAPATKFYTDWAWQENFSANSATQKATIDQDLKALADKAVTYAITSMKL